MADNIVPIKRPRPADGEEELLQMQRDFEEKKLLPCVQVVDKRATAPLAKKQSKFARDRQAEAEKKRICTSQFCGSVTNQDAELDASMVDKKIDPIHNYTELPVNFILGNVVERKSDTSEFKSEIGKNLEDSLHTGFPAVFISPETLEDTDSKKSLFLRSISKQCYEKEISLSDLGKPGTKSTSSHIVSGPWAQEIHEENVEKLKGMSQEEILAEKKNLEAMLNPETISFIKSIKESRNQLKDKIFSIGNCKDMEIDEMQPSASKHNQKIDFDDKSVSHLLDNKMDIDSEATKNLELPEPVVDIVKDAVEKGWVHMDDVEPEKVKWMEDLSQKEDKTQPTAEPYNARFDFHGTLLPFNDESLTVDKGLHHHGEEPERPGYSLQELLQLSRSAAQQQRCTALTTLAHILEKTHLGWYDRALQPSLLQTLNQKNALLLLRFSLDDTALPVVTAALQVLRAFIFSETDEICLDKTFGLEDFDEPILKPSIQDVDDVQSLKDHELVQFDSVAALMRSDIVIRIRYILNEMQLPLAGLTAALEILARLARHSRETALNIACTPDLLDIIVNKCIPFSLNQPVPDRDSSKPYGCPLAAAIRLGRILIIYAGRPVIERLKNLKIVNSLINYVTSDATRQEVRLHIESLRLWRLFLHYGVETDSVTGARLTLISQLKILSCTLDVNESTSPLKYDYAAALIAIAKYDEALKEHVAILLAKWSTQLSRISSPTWNHTVLVSECIRALDNISFLERSWLNKSSMFSQLSVDCSASSNLLSNLDPASDRDPSSLPSLGVMTYEGQLQPIMDQKSKIVLLRTMFEYALKSSYEGDVKKIFESKNFQKYLKKLKSSDWSLERSWFTRIEYSLLVAVIQAENHFKIVQKTELGDTIWKIAIKLISALPADCPLSVRDILVYSLLPERVNLRLLESKLEDLGLSEKLKDLETLGNPHLAVQLYEKYVSPNGSWSEAAMPKDWIYLPLVSAYTQMRKEKAWRYSQTCDILQLLKLELIMPELTQNLPVHLRFSRLLLLYLCDDVFIHAPKCELSQKVFSQLVKVNYKKLDLAADVPGLSSFTDLFTALCENFAAHSYGVDIFAQVLLVFVAQRFDIHYRKLLWSEHAGVIRYCSVQPQDFYLPFDEEYLFPLEKDASLIETYITALVRNTVREEQSPGLYRVALHHAAMYLKETSKLATVMRSRIEKLLIDERMRNIGQKLLNYVPPPLPLGAQLFK
ncbi:RNA polymerase II-associated protein 1 isoform X2 [Copidosoma floridanum]|uniref:RNA polymerase II-associated protein 1 isoform X2 n=1 Tax=Copidosoma floridanum TaxID=29053 RepID=UPI0006C9CA17|nr:RNA polymerase II-associated protein 1 isoform X2 [Copidosoma floridanum]